MMLSLTIWFLTSQKKKEAEFRTTSDSRLHSLLNFKKQTINRHKTLLNVYSQLLKTVDSHLQVQMKWKLLSSLMWRQLRCFSAKKTLFNSIAELILKLIRRVKTLEDGQNQNTLDSLRQSSCLAIKIIKASWSMSVLEQENKSDHTSRNTMEKFSNSVV